MIFKKSKNYLLCNILFVIIGIISTIILSININQTYNSFQKRNFDNIVHQYTFFIQDEIKHNLDELIELGKLFNLFPNITRDDFRYYVSDILERHPSIHALSWNPMINHNMRNIIEQKTQIYFSDPNITILELKNGKPQKSSNKTIYVPVYYIEPIEINRNALLLDVSSNTFRNITLYKAIETYQQTSTKQIKLIQEYESQPGFLVFNPVFNNNDILGFSVGVFRAGDMVSNIIKNLVKNSSPNKFVIYDEKDYLLTTEFTKDDFLINYENNNINETKLFTKKTYIYFADRKWTLIFQSKNIPTNDVLILIIITIPLITIISSLLFSFLIKYFEHNLMKKQTEIKNQFIDYIFHEIRVPLNTIIIGINNLKTNVIFEPEYEQLNIIDKSLQQTTHILNDILDMNKIYNGKFEIQREFININNLIHTIIQSFITLSRSKNISLTCYIDDRLNNKDINLDIHRITQCLNNYLSNAFKYTPTNGDIKLEVKIIDNNKIQFCVIDNGCGISLNDQQKLFQPYIQISTNNKSEVGTGLGLVITKQISKLHNGDAWVVSKENEGSEFYFTISSEIQESTNNIKAIENKDKSYNNLKFLIVDDNQSNCFVLKEFLKSKNISADVANNGKIAINKIKINGNYDLILMDKHMPEMNGVEATKKIRNMGINIPIVALTGIASSKEKDEFKNAGINDILIKPIDFKLFNNILNKYFN